MWVGIYRCIWREDWFLVWEFRFGCILRNDLVCFGVIWYVGCVNLLLCCVWFGWFGRMGLSFVLRVSFIFIRLWFWCLYLSCSFILFWEFLLLLLVKWWLKCVVKLLMVILVILWFWNGILLRCWCWCCYVVWCDWVVIVVFLRCCVRWWWLLVWMMLNWWLFVLLCVSKLFFMDLCWFIVKFLSSMVGVICIWSCIVFLSWVSGRLWVG